MPSASPEDDEWLSALVRQSPLLPDPTLRRHWLSLVPWLSTEQRYTLAAILVEVERACST
jgi:hypothetical protein